MASNEGAGDEESQFTSRIQPFSSTPRQVWRASLAELLGTATLVFAIDTLVISSYETETKMPNLVMSILIAISVTILLLATGPVSGGHINPVITFSAALIGLISISRAIIYILAQCIGGVVGALALKAVVVTTKKGYAGVGMNPARCFGPAVIRGGHLWDGHWVFWVGPAISCVAFYLYVKIIPREHINQD
ncbi:hypothetical protein IFM89_014758 [Coptis chinensis]|uniref:Aquaporin n=1 Tax=Coptis chinensis TaxID=261450 RepID=A0A835IMS7_9MAGN|nr:hypothetical protein IFM89_014758 [Coptis chinensis]